MTRGLNLKVSSPTSVSTLALMAWLKKESEAASCTLPATNVLWCLCACAAAWRNIEDKNEKVKANPSHIDKAKIGICCMFNCSLAGRNP
mmetsp:Transcript_19531/g.29468  ORF Transcript_19531/g.29468 Transcript_19531/m.29468 type:complete len:89 (-) Transcript_19531:129-395(-)